MVVEVRSLGLNDVRSSVCNLWLKLLSGVSSSRVSGITEECLMLSSLPASTLLGRALSTRGASKIKSCSLLVSMDLCSLRFCCVTMFSETKSVDREGSVPIPLFLPLCLFVFFDFAMSLCRSSSSTIVSEASFGGTSTSEA